MAAVNDVGDDAQGVAAGPPAEVYSPGDPGRPGTLALLGAVARRHYLEGKSKVEIAEELGLSRFKVARLLEEARARGVVRIEVVDDTELDAPASLALQQALGLRHAVVVADGVAEDRRTRLATVAARFLTELLGPDDVLGLPWSRTVGAMVARLTALPAIPVVQLCGAGFPTPDVGSPEDPEYNAVELVARVARLAGSEAHVFFSPLLVGDADTAAALRRDPQVGAALARIGEVTKAVVGVGAWRANASTIFDACDSRERDEAESLGVVGEIAGVFFDAAGRPVDTRVGERLIGPDAAALRAIPEAVALAAGEDKARAVAAAVAGGFVQGLVTDAALARVLLAADVRPHHGTRSGGGGRSG